MARKKASKPKRTAVRLDQAHGFGRVQRIDPRLLERQHREDSPEWAQPPDGDDEQQEGVMAA
ncbi:hypothetical protein [Amycolatopsis taiwanensis]|uniref:hypothetical protein n=1 Tax=Amycolatopsis taiwanensis TaxID=342230 RepID=UPI0004895AD8|nr:hypothetical protein [Amycolatopsis taiwanensis]